MRTRNFLLGGLLIALQCVCSAAIVNLSGDVVEASPSAAETFAQISLVDSRATIADRTLPLGFPTGGMSFFPAGTLIDEYLVNYSPLSALGSANGSVTFSGRILGFYPLDELEITDVDGFPNTADIVSITPDGFTLNFSLNVNTGFDRFGVLVAQAVPEPSSALLIMAGILALAAVRRPRFKL
jgi:hypothetical protein